MMIARLRTGYKQTEVGIVPIDWELKTLGDVGEVKMCRRIFNNETKSEGTIPFYKIGTFGKDADAYISQELYSNYRQRFSFPQKGEILISAAGTIGRTLIYDGKPAYFQDSNIVWIDNNETLISNKFLYYVFQVVKYNTEGGTIQRLYNNILKSTKFICPGKAEQTAIALTLSDNDALITSLEKLIEKKRAIKQGAMQELLKPKDGWVTKRLGEVAEIRDGTHQTPKYFESGIPFYSVESITNNDFKNTKFISEEEHRILTKTFKIDKGDILMTRIGSIGDCKLIDWEVNASFYVSLALLKINAGTSASYLCHYSKSSMFTKEIELNSLQSAIPRKINLGPISDVRLELPNIEEQIRIAKILTDMNAEISTLNQKLSKYKLLKKGMMQELLTGKTRLV